MPHEHDGEDYHRSRDDDPAPIPAQHQEQESACQQEGSRGAVEAARIVPPAAQRYPQRKHHITERSVHCGNESSVVVDELLRLGRKLPRRPEQATEERVDRIRVLHQVGDGPGEAQQEDETPAGRQAPGAQSEAQGQGCCDHRSDDQPVVLAGGGRRCPHGRPCRPALAGGQLDEGQHGEEDQEGVGICPGGVAECLGDAQQDESGEYAVSPPPLPAPLHQGRERAQEARQADGSRRPEADGPSRQRVKQLDEIRIGEEAGPSRPVDCAGFEPEPREVEMVVHGVASHGGHSGQGQEDEGRREDQDQAPAMRAPAIHQHRGDGEPEHGPQHDRGQQAGPPEDAGNSAYDEDSGAQPHRHGAAAGHRAARPLEGEEEGKELNEGHRELPHERKRTHGEPRSKLTRPCSRAVPGLACCPWNTGCS